MVTKSDPVAGKPTSLEATKKVRPQERFDKYNYLDKGNFDTSLGKGPVIVKFGMSFKKGLPNCPACENFDEWATKKLIPTIGKHQVRVSRVDIRNDNFFVEKFALESQPTFIFFNQGKEVARKLGFSTEDKGELEKFCRNLGTISTAAEAALRTAIKLPRKADREIAAKVAAKEK